MHSQFHMFFQNPLFWSFNEHEKNIWQINNTFLGPSTLSFSLYRYGQMLRNWMLIKKQGKTDAVGSDITL